MSRLLLALALVFSVSCKGGSSYALDAGNLSPASDADDGVGTGALGSGSTPVLPDAAIVPPDANTAYEPVDCRGDDDCTSDMSCALEVPGGVCSGCSDDPDCGEGLTCRFGTCSRSCEDDTDCSPGRACNFSGRCGQRRCNSNTPCPAPLRVRWHSQPTLRATCMR